MKKILILVLALTSNQVFAMGGDDPMLGMLKVDQLEMRQATTSTPLVLESDAWLGYDLNKLWLKLDAESVNGALEEAEVQALYSRAVAPFWDAQVGIRHDEKPGPSRNWLAIGFKGLAPYFFDIDSSLFISEDGQTALRLQAEYEFMLTQRWVLSPDATMNVYSKSEPSRDIGAGLADLQLGLRLRYEFVREFAPYLGINWNSKLGETADLVRAGGGSTGGTMLVAGLRFWF